MDELTSWVARSGFLPHGVCYAWSPSLLWAMVGADAVIAAAYYSIPVALVAYARKRADQSFTGIMWMFSAFIFACGTTHLMSIWTVWVPSYGIEAALKLFTAAVSIVTAIALWPLIPKALRIPSVGQLQAVIATLEAEVAQRRRAEENLADTKESLAITLASIGAGFIATDRAGCITRMNPVAEAITGWSLAEALGRSWWEVVRDDSPIDTPQDRNPVDLLIEVDRPAHAAVHRVMLSRQGVRTPVESSAAPIRAADGGVRGMAVVFRDLTEHQRNEELRARSLALESQNRQIQEANRLKSEFVANMSHELRTPLNAIIGFADLLHGRLVPVDSPKHHEFLGHIRTSGHHLLQLINDVLDLAKVESGKFEFFPEPVEIKRLIDEVVAMQRHSASAKDIRIATEFDERLVDIELDPNRFKQVLYNYLSNAIKFTPHGGYITVRALSNGDDAFRLEVEDTGIGISEADQARLFVDFQQLDGSYSKQHAGTGLGLALTKRLVRAQGGSVGLHSELGVGTVFYALLPRRPLDTRRTLSQPDGAADAGSPLRSLDRGGPGLSSPRILVIEDPDEQVSPLTAGLRQRGYEVDVASSESQALRRAQVLPYTAIALDLMLAGGRAMGALVAVRERGPNRDTPVRALTAGGANRGQAGFAVSDVLNKPISGDDLHSALDQAGLRAKPTFRLMVIDDDDRALEMIGALLDSLQIPSVRLTSGQEALDRLDEIAPDALILDLMMPGMDGFAVLDAVRRSPRWGDLPVFIWSGTDIGPEEHARLSASVDAIVAKGGGGIDALLEQVMLARPRSPRS